MIKNLTCLLMAFALMPCFFSPVMAKDDNILNFSVWDKETTVVDNILYTALQELGYELSFSTMGLTPAILAANSGETDGITAMVSGYPYQQTDELIPIPVQVSACEVTVLARSDFEGSISGWEDLNGFRIGTVYGDHHATGALNGFVISPEVAATSEELYSMLLNNEIDVFLQSKSVYLQARYPEGIQELGVIDTKPMYSYVHKKHKDLVPALTNIYERMLQDGRFEKFQEGEAASPSFRNNILHITSYNRDMLWEGSIRNGVEHALEESGADYSLQIMSLNAKRIREQKTMEQALFNSVRSNMTAERPDVVLVSDNNALDFVVDNYHTLFNQIPVVFCGINGYSQLHLNDLGEYFTGITEEVSASETIREMLKLYPETKKIFVINDYLKSGLLWKQDIIDQATEFESSLEIEYNEDLSLQHLLGRISMLEPETLILTGLYHVDAGGTFVTENELNQMLSNATELPIFSLMDLPVGRGAIGGKVVDGFAQGYDAGKMLVDILGGRPVSHLPVMVNTEGLNNWKFDENALAEFDIDESGLPEGSLIINKKQPFYIERPSLFAFIMSTGLMLAIASCFVIFIFTTRKQAKEARTSQKELERLMDELPVAIAIIRPETNSLIYSNRFFRDMFGLSDLTIHTDYDYRSLFPKYQQNGKLSEEFFKENSDAVLSQNAAVTTDWQYITPAGKLLNAHLTKSHINYQRERCLVSIIQDVEAEKRRERLLMLAAEKEKEANQTKSRFLVNVSHEIRTPMNAIIGFSQLALLRAQDDDNFGTFKRIDKAAQNLLSIINDILDFSSMESDKFELTEDSFALEHIIASAFSVAVEKIEGKRIEPILNMSGELDYQFIGDKNRVWQILKNILDNSAKYTEEGRIILDVFPAEEQKEEGIRSVVFRIEDSGLGMSSSQLKKLFIPFEQFHVNKTKNYVPGTGLGMSIIKEIIQIMGGELSVESKEMTGTVVTVILPLKRDKNPVAFKDSLSCGMEHSSMLILDRDTYCLNSVSNLLSFAGIEPVCVSDREAALFEVKKHEESGTPFDIVIAGASFAEASPPLPRAIKDITAKAPLCILSSVSSASPPREKLLELGFADHIEKPFIPSVFLDALKNISADWFSEYNGGLPDFSAVRTLLCEDNLLNQEVARGMLDVFGITPSVAENGEEALELLKKDEFDLVLMDIQMPVMDGITATKLIRNSETPYKDIVIIAVTANIMKEDIEKYLAIGMNSHIGKPLSLELLQKELFRFFPLAKAARPKNSGKPDKPKEEPGLPLIDFTDGVTRFGGKEDRYIKVLLKFADDIKEPLKSFDELFAVEDTEVAARDIHTQKGVAGNLGLSKLFNAVRSFETTLKEGAPDRALYDAISPIRDETREEILKRRPQDEKANDEPLDRGSDKEFIEIATALLASLELSEPFGSEEGIEKLKSKIWSKIDKETIEKLETCVNDYDFYEAEELMRAILEGGI